MTAQERFLEKLRRMLLEQGGYQIHPELGTGPADQPTLIVWDQQLGTTFQLLATNLGA